MKTSHRMFGKTQTNSQRSSFGIRVVVSSSPRKLEIRRPPPESTGCEIPTGRPLTCPPLGDHATPNAGGGGIDLVEGVGGMRQ